jgi:heat shock protein HslJ
MGALGLSACAVAPGEGAPSSNPPASATPAASTAAPGASAPAVAAAAASPAGSLVGTRWTGVVEATPDPRMLPRLEFAGQGRVFGFTGCNMLSGAWRMEGDEIRIGPLVTTKRGCIGPAGDLERRVLAAMGENARVTREGRKLVLIGADGARFEFEEAAAT